MRKQGAAAGPSSERSLKKTGKTVTVHVFDYIDWLGFDVAYYGPALDKMRDVEEIIVKINSPGGSAFDGAAFYNTLVQHPAKVRVEVHGLAGSAASVIAMAGDQILMGTAARLFIHKPWALAAGNDDVFFRLAEDLKSMTADFVDLYRQQAVKLSKEEILAMLAKETELSAAEAVAKGFATGRLNAADAVKAAKPTDDIRSIDDMRASLITRHAKLIRPHDDSRPALSERRREHDLLKAKRASMNPRHSSVSA